MEKNTNNKELENIKLDDEIIEKVNGGMTIKSKAQSSERDENEDGKGQSGIVDGNWTFTENRVFSSPSMAAGVVMGRSANGLIEWKIKMEE